MDTEAILCLEELLIARISDILDAMPDAGSAEWDARKLAIVNVIAETLWNLPDGQ